MIATSITVPGLPEVMATLDAFPATLKIELASAARLAGLAAESTIKARTPRSTGYLFGSIHSVAADFGGYAGAIVGTPVEYAKYQEFGTKAHGPKHARFLRFHVGGRTVFAKRVRGVKARHFFGEGLIEAKPVVVDIFKLAMQKAMRTIKAA